MRIDSVCPVLTYTKTGLVLTCYPYSTQRPAHLAIFNVNDHCILKTLSICFTYNLACFLRCPDPLCRYGENVEEANANPDWVCPVCRDICNCSRCRKVKGWEPTGNLYRKVSLMTLINFYSTLFIESKLYICFYFLPLW